MSAATSGSFAPQSSPPPQTSPNLPMASRPTKSKRSVLAGFFDGRPWALCGIVLGVVLFVWELAKPLGVLPPYIFPPSMIARSLFRLVESGVLLPLLGQSLRRAATGYLFGATAGLILGMFTGVAAKLGDFIDGPVAATYPIPKVALFPAIAVVLGFNDRTRIIVIALACFYPAYLNAQSGTRSVPKDLMWFARNTEASKLRQFRSVVVRSALPRAFAGLRISLALAFVMMFATEVIGFGNGLGSAVFRARLEGEYDIMWAGVVAIGLVGWLCDTMLVAAGNKIMKGQRLEAHRG
jgi:ABC-type nitrate/sulfonate/bicarbonate transport system permease component